MKNFTISITEKGYKVIGPDKKYTGDFLFEQGKEKKIFSICPGHVTVGYNHNEYITLASVKLPVAKEIKVEWVNISELQVGEVDQLDIIGLKAVGNNFVSVIKGEKVNNLTWAYIDTPEIYVPEINSIRLITTSTYQQNSRNVLVSNAPKDQEETQKRDVAILRTKNNEPETRFFINSFEINKRSPISMPLLAEMSSQMNDFYKTVKKEFIMAGYSWPEGAAVCH